MIRAVISQRQGGNFLGQSIEGNDGNDCCRQATTSAHCSTHLDFVTKYLSYKMAKYELWPVNMAQHGKTTKIEAAHDVGIQSLSDCRFKDNAVWGKS